MGDFYRRWGAGDGTRAGENDLAQARELLARYGAATARELLPELVGVLRRKWPACKSFSGAVQKYLPDAVRAHDFRQRRRESRCRAEAEQQRARESAARNAEEQARLEARWRELPEERRAEVERAVLQKHPAVAGCPGILRLLCLEQLARSLPAEGTAEA